MNPEQKLATDAATLLHAMEQNKEFRERVYRFVHRQAMGSVDDAVSEAALGILRGAGL